MKYTITTGFLLLNLFLITLNAQTNSQGVNFNITDQMDVFTTQFRVFSNAENLTPAKQLIGKRVFSKQESAIQSETWSFEFTSANALKKIKEADHKGQYKVSCFEDKKTLLFSIYLTKEDLIIWNNGTYYTYAINMQNFPIVLMDTISIIDIVEVE